MCPGSRPRFPRHTQYSSSVRCYILSKRILCCLLLLTALLIIVLRDFLYFCVRRRLVGECVIVRYLLRGIATIIEFSGWIIRVCCDVIILDWGG